MENEYPFTTFNFLVWLWIENAGGLGLSTPLCNSEFAECDGLEMTMEPKTVREGGNNTQQIRLVGPVSYGNLTLKRGMTPNLDLWKWFLAASGSAARGALAQGMIIMLDAGKRPSLIFALTDCLPIKIKAPALNAKDGLVAIEEMQIAYSSFTVDAV
jgi:phage tail-like protein